MSQPFSFAFDAEDIEADQEEERSASSQHHNDEPVNVEVIPPQLHNLKDLLSTLPSQISFSSTTIKGKNDSTINILRRDLFDIRAQIMAEDSTPNERSAIGLSPDDIVPNKYEGGFKTWECSVDLAEYLCSKYDFQHKDQLFDTTIIELGAGTALPSLALFRQWLAHREDSHQARPPSLQLCLTDYNLSVLQLATIPNLLLASEQFDRQPEASKVDTEAERLEQFQSALARLDIDVSAISGSWTPRFVDLVPPLRRSGPSGRHETIILASETIYSPTSIRVFTQVVLDILVRAQKSGSGNVKAFVAAKKVYFGVGGGTDDFLRVLEDLGGTGRVAWDTHGAGVGRVILEVTKSQ